MIFWQTWKKFWQKIPQSVLGLTPKLHYPGSGRLFGALRRQPENMVEKVSDSKKN
jgi:hypothetical protein